MDDGAEKEISPAPPPQGDGTPATPPSPSPDGQAALDPPPKNSNQTIPPSSRPAEEGLKPETPTPEIKQSSNPNNQTTPTDAPGETIKRVAVAVEDIDEHLDPAWLEVIKKIARDTPETRWRHSSHFSQDEDRIIAAALVSLTPVYKIAQTLRCDRHTLTKHIEEDTMLAQLLADQRETRREKVQEGVDQLVEIHHPAVIMWAAEHQLSDIYGKDKQMEEEDDSMLVIGEIPEASLAEADAILAAADATPPEVGLTAMLDERVTSTPASQPTAASPALPAPSTAPANPNPAPPPPEIKQSNNSNNPTNPPLPNTREPDYDNTVDDGSYGGGFDDYNDFGGGGWLS